MLRRTVLVLLAVLSAAPALAADNAKVAAHLYSRSTDGTIKAALVLQIADGWHLYHTELGPPDAIGKPTVITMTAAGAEWSAPVFPAPKRLEQPGLGDDGKDTWIWGHEGRVVVRIEGTLTPPAKGDDVAATISGLTCLDDGMCVPYRAQLVSEGAGDDALFAASASAPGNSPGGAAGDTAKAAAALSGEQLGLAQFLLLAVAGGLFTLLMPCTYPMIPITISFFTKQATMRHGKVVPLAIAYGLGIVAIFVFIGVVLGSLIIPFATNPITNLLIGALFVVFALTLFGALDLPVPSFLLDAAGSASRSGGYAGVFLMGATLVITSFTCTVPFVGSLLSVGAQQGQLLRIALGMAVFGLTMAVPFVFLSLLPGRLGAMPRSGEWMHHLKVFLGFVEIAAALKFISNSDLVWGWGFLTRELFLVLWFGIFLAAALYLFGLIRMEGDSAEIRPMRMTAALATLLFSLYCGYGALGHELDSVMTAIAPNYSRPLGGPGQQGAKQRGADAHTIVLDDYDAAREQALQQARPLLVNFTGHTCVNCRLMEEKVFRQPAVAAELQNVVEARLHTDGRRNLERILALQSELTGVTANPFYVLVDPKDGRVVARFAGATRDEQVFIQFLKSGRAS